jgi:hypothetical protein
MTATAVVLAALLAAVLVLWAARPFLSSRAGEEPAPDEDAERIRLLEERDRALAALKELEFDHRTGKVADADYRRLVPALRSDAASALRALDELAGQPSGSRAPASDGAVPREPEREEQAR